MAKYKIVNHTWLNFPSGPRLVVPLTPVETVGGKMEFEETVIDFDGWPNAAMEPLDDEGHELADAIAKMRATGQPIPATPKAWRARKAPPGVKSSVEIPDNWKELRPEQQINLARKLGCPMGAKLPDALEFLVREIVRRETQPQTAAA